MKPIRVLLAAVTLAGAVAACADAPTAVRTPTVPNFDGGSFGPGARAGGDASTASGGEAPADSTGAVERGGSFGPGA